MSSLAHILTMWEDVLAQLRRKSVSWQGNPLSERDRCTFTEAIVMCALHLTDLSTRHGGIGTNRELVGWATQVVSVDVHQLGSFLSDAVTHLRQVYEPTDFKRFKRRLSEHYPFAGMMLSPIRGALTEFLSMPNPRGFYVCYQYLSFLTHLSLLDLNVDLESEYEELEQSLSSLSYPRPLLDSLNAIMREWLKDFSVTEDSFVPFHGPGATAELSADATQLSKYRYLGTDMRINYVFNRAGIDVTTYFPLPPSNWRRTCKLVFVPKSMKTRRAISKEPTTLMYHQEGIFTCLDAYVSKHAELSRHINLHDQRKSAELAISGSKSGQYATIDLSSASDRVTLSLVKAVFRGTPLLPYLIALRSETVVLPSGKELRLEKYAPMGSALCFPVQTLIFSCIVEHVVRQARGHTGYFPVWRVFGDDIIVREPIFWDTVMALESLGFVLNLTKSFSNPYRFRESCGGEGYDGVRVTPMKISRNFKVMRGRLAPRHAALYEGLINMANEAYVYKFPLLRAWIIRVLLGNSIAPPLFSGSCNGSLYSPWPDNYRAKAGMSSTHQKVNDYQRMEIQVAVVRSTRWKGEWSEDLEQARYYETLRLIATKRSTDDMFHPDHRIQVPRGSGPTRIKKMWVEKPTLS